jgi:ATPase subunit of ABC transporter with duplicated ATPase domains
MFVTLSDISYTYNDAPEIVLSGVSLTLSPGWTGVVGANGSGKTTLLRVAAGDLSGFSGQITPTNLYGVYCAQTTEAEPSSAFDFALDFSAEAVTLRRRLGVDDDWVWRYDSLSQGERKRLQIAVALWQQPTLLALDEPGNHLDLPTRELLVPVLRDYAASGGVGLLVSHDRFLLDNLVGQCLFLKPGQATLRPGTYSQATADARRDAQTMARQRRDAKAEFARLQGEKRRRATEAKRADARRSRRHLAKGDSDGRARISLAIVSGQDGKAGKRSTQLDSRLSAVQDTLRQARVGKHYEGGLWISARPGARKVLVSVPEGRLLLGEDGERNLHFPELVVESASHIGLTGANGAGKSTLVRRLLAAVPSDVPRLYLPQELDADSRRQVLEKVRALAPQERGRVLSLVARLNSDPDRVLSGNMLSPGETRKLLLALGICTAPSPQLIIADEPTNHLDIGSIEALQDAFAAYPCALVVVSHDQQFLSAASSVRWTFAAAEEGVVQVSVSET